MVAVALKASAVWNGCRLVSVSTVTSGVLATLTGMVRLRCARAERQRGQGRPAG